MKLKEKVENLLKAYDFSPKSYFSQNFLIDPRIIARLVEEIKIEKDDLILEIGAGTGILTSFLVEKARKVWAVEVDEKLCEILKKELGEKEELEIICQDIAKVNLDLLFSGKKIKVVGNIPYHITSWLLLFLVRKKWWKQMILTIQKEVAEKLTSPPGDKKRSFLPVVVSFYADVRKVMDIPPQAFYPSPKVTSSVVRLRPKKKTEELDEELFMKIVKAAFTSKRKTLVNSLSMKLKLPREIIKDVLLKVGLSEKIRAEKLKTEDFVEITKFFMEEKIAC